MSFFDGFKKKGVIKTQTDTVCNHSEALPNSIFCPSCGAKIEHTFQKSSTPKRTINIDINHCYICVLHFRCISAWITPMSHPVKKYAVAYNGKYNNAFLECMDDKKKIRIKADREELTLEFDTYTEKMPYSINEVCKYNVPVYDAMESWAFIISDAPIQNELFMPGYQLKEDGIYYNIEDMQEDRKKSAGIFDRFT